MVNVNVQENLARLKALLADTSLDLKSALDKFARQTRDPTIDRLLCLAALARSFDRRLYEKVLAKTAALAPRAASAQMPPFDEFVTTPDIEVAPGETDRFRISPGAREQYMREWREHPQDCALLNSELAAYEQEVRPHNVLARLPHLIDSGSPDALALFNKAFDEADERFDLAQCFGLLNVLDPRIGRLGPEWHDALVQRKRRYHARSLFADAWYRTGTYYYRAKPHRHFKSVLNDERRWIFNQHATGGMGKTMFLRWLIARHLVPQGIVCARIDLDEFRLDAVRKWPWLLLAPLAAQLDQQFWPPILAETLSLVQPYTHLLYSPTGTTEPIGETPIDPDPLCEDFIKGIVWALNQSGAKKVVLVIDTLEVATVFPDTFERIFQHLRTLHAAAPAVRVVLSGRYPLGSKVPNLLSTLAEEAVVSQLSRFDASEANAYLLSRDIKDSALRQAIVEKVKESGRKDTKGCCNPFKLALLADLVLGKERITPTDIRELPSADYQYLLERVIKRIPEQPLRWVVRYGVVPRRLTQDYMEHVMLAPLRRALNGEEIGDLPHDPVTLPQEIQWMTKQDIWRRESSEDLAAGPLWDQLMRYESGRGWISYVGKDPTRQGAMYFHGDVVNPMRDLLSYQAVFRELQKASAQYFSARADSAFADYTRVFDPRKKDEHAERWTDMTCEAIFHAFQAEDPQANLVWLDALDEELVKIRPGLRLKLAREPLGREYCEAEEHPRRRRDKLVVMTSTLGLAHLYAAKAVLDSLLYSGPGGAAASISELRHHKEFADRLLNSADLCGEMRARVNIAHLQGVLQASLLLLDDRPTEANAVLIELLNSGSDARSCIDVFCLLAHANFGTHEASEYLAVAIRRIEARLPDFPLWRLLFEAARNEFAQGDFGQARTRLAAALSDVLQRDDRNNAIALVSSFFRREVAFGYLGSANRLIDIMAGLIGKRDPRIELFRAMLAQEHFDTTWSGYESLLVASRRAKLPTVQLDTLVVAGQMAADLLSFSCASRHWTDATQLIERSGGSMQLSVLAVHQARARNRMGAYSDALTIASSALTSATHRHWSLTQIEFQRAIAFASSGQPHRAAQVLEALIAPNQPRDLTPAKFESAISFLPEGRAEQTNRLLEASLSISLERQQYLPAYALTLGLALGVLLASEAHLWTLRSWLETLYAPLRLRVLSGLRFCQGVLKVPKEWAHGILEMLDFEPSPLSLPSVPVVDDPPETGGIDHDGQCFARCLDRFDVHRALGSTKAARKILLELAARVHPVEMPLRALLVEEAWMRLGEARPVFPLEWTALVDQRPTLLGSVLLLNRAEAFLATDTDTAEIEAILEAATRGLQSEHLPTSWDARHFELTGRLAERRGDLHEAERLLRIAFEMCRELGDGTGQRRASTYLAALTRAGAPGTGQAKPASVLPQTKRWSNSDRIVISPAGAEGSHLADQELTFLQTIAPRDGQTVSQSLASALAGEDWDALRRSFGQMLFSDAIRMKLESVSEPAVIALLVPQAFLSALPWELAAFPGEDAWGCDDGRAPIRAWSRVRSASKRPAQETVRFVQHRLTAAGFGDLGTDGILGPVTADAIFRFQSQHGLRATGEIDSASIAAIAHATPISRPRVLIVQSSVAPDSMERTTYGSRSGKDLQAYYYENFADVRVVAASDADEVIEVVSRFKPTLIHLVATVRETRGMVFIDFARRRGNSEGGAINATALDTLIKRLYVNEPRPFLVFDAVRPYSTLDAAFALGWRNALASDLLHFGSFSGILATGLEHPEMLGSIAEVVLTGLSSGSTMGELAISIRGLYQSLAHTRGRLSAGFEGTDQDRALAYLGTVLFAQDPDLPCLLF